MIQNGITKLVEYGIRTGLLQEEDRIYATNQILDVLKLDEYEESGEGAGDGPDAGDLERILKELLDTHAARG